MRRSFFTLFLASLALAAALPAHAEKGDRNKPMNIEADALRHDQISQTSVFTGHVVLTKGTITLRGGTLEVNQDPSGYQYGTATGASGQRAFFRQRRDTAPNAPEEWIEGEADTIKYDGRSDKVHFIGHAELRRYVGSSSVPSDQINGSVIDYDNVADVFTVDSGKNSSARNPRVHATMAPKAEAANGDGQSAAPTPGGRAGDGAPLQSTPRLNDRKAK